MVKSIYQELNDKDWLYNKFVVENLRVSEIARKLHCHRSSVHRAILKLELYVYKKRSRFPKLSDIDWLKKELETKSYVKIAKELGTSPGNVADRVKRHKIICYSSNKSEAVKEGLRKRYKELPMGEKANHWKGGRRMINGYVMIYSPNHPNATRAKTVFEHRLVIEKQLGRYLRRDEVVHHINGVKSDNRIENLEVCSRSKHVEKHFDKGKEVMRLRKILEDNKIPY